METTKIDKVCTDLQSLVYCNANLPIPLDLVFNIREGIAGVVQQISDINSPASIRLNDLKKTLFTENSSHCFYLNPVVYGQTLEFMEIVKENIFVANQTDNRGLCHLLHPDIQRVSEKLYRDGSYAEAACNAFIEINARVKRLYQKLCPGDTNSPDGQALMNKVFADKEPVIEAADRSTQTGRDIHMGTRFLFSGAMAALRNPKSHENNTIGKDDAMRRLIFASMLMFQIDEIIAVSDGVD